LGDKPVHGGNTSLEETLPILALKVDGSPPPNHTFGDVSPSHAWPKELYQGWACGRIALTPPIKGTEITSAAMAEAFCREHCGEGYRMAEFHDGRCIPGMALDKFHGDTWPPYEELEGGGWKFCAYGDIPDGVRFWVKVTGTMMTALTRVRPTYSRLQRAARGFDLARRWDRHDHGGGRRTGQHH
jgi:hypothetical protein